MEDPRGEKRAGVEAEPEAEEARTDGAGGPDSGEAEVPVETDEGEVFAGESPEEDQEKKELREKYLRLFAEFDNYRKRVAREREDLLNRATEKVVTDILTVVDHLELALEHRENDSAEPLIKGVEITLREFVAALEKNGVTAIEAKGLPFDPSVHHAMSQVETESVDENTVVEEFRKGYRLGDRIIRPSLVAVAKRPAEEAGVDSSGASQPPETQ